VIQRGEIWWAELGDAEGSAPAHRRPVLVIQADAFNRSRIASIVAVALTSHVRLADAPGNVLIPKRDSGLPRDSVVNVSQLVTLDRADLAERVGPLPQGLMRQVDRGLRLVLDL
jgi:mRNA interferase MazF